MTPCVHNDCTAIRYTLANAERLGSPNGIRRCWTEVKKIRGDFADGQTGSQPLFVWDATGLHGKWEVIVSMKTVLVPTEKSDMTAATLETALLFAKHFESYIEGFALRAAISDFVAADLIVADAWAVAETRDAELAKEARTAFEGFMQARSVPVHVEGQRGLSYGWTEADAARDAFVGSYGRVFDIIVFGRPGSYPAGSSMAAVEAALFESGRPILIAPPTPLKTLGENIVVAWNRSSETARCLALAMPLLHKAAKVTVLTVTGGMVAGPEAPDVVRYLARNGITANSFTLEANSGTASGEAFLQKAEALGCDLMIKGAYTQSRLRQMIFGGATSHILAKTTMPVFMAH
jgi:nucleotide-binding universal stress UspA family protein